MTLAAIRVRSALFADVAEGSWTRLINVCLIKFNIGSLYLLI